MFRGCNVALGRRVLPDSSWVASKSGSAFARRLGSSTSRFIAPVRSRPSRPTSVSLSAPRHVIPFHASAKQLAASIESPSSPEIPKPYSPPTTGLLSRLPASWVPYAELVRLDKPAGTYYLFFPCMFSTLLAAPMADPVTSPLTAIGTTALFFSGALIMRGAGCSINDLWDRNLDPQVARTRLRPIARGAITPFKALTFTGVQLLAGLGDTPPVPLELFLLRHAELALRRLVPPREEGHLLPAVRAGADLFMGRHDGLPGAGRGPARQHGSDDGRGLLVRQQRRLDRRHQEHRPEARRGDEAGLSGLAVVQVGLLGAAGWAAGAGPAFFIGGCGGAALTLGYMIRKVNLKNVKDCWWWFVNGCWITGGAITVGLGADYVIQYSKDSDEPEKIAQV
ncbi:hypothetical protein PG987_013311 [Apiospora arundinis]